MADIREAIIIQFLSIINRECTVLCQKSSASPSHFRNIPIDQIENFNWGELVDELKLKVPLLLKILTTIATRNDHRNVSKIGSAHYPGICTASAVMLKERNREINGVQSIVSLLMYSCHCEKQVQCMYMYNVHGY